jgi:hypothetical protein
MKSSVLVQLILRLMSMFNHFAAIDEFFSVLLWGWVFYRAVLSKKPKPAIIVGIGRCVKFVLILLTFGLLAGCSNPDPLAVASGPVFALNASHWQPTPQELANPPAVVEK